MSKLSAAVKSASRRTKDVRVVLNGELAQEREQLLRAVAEASQAAKRDQRLSKRVDESAKVALDEWDEQHKDDVLTIRVVQATQAEWRLVQRKNPIPKSDTSRDMFDARYGFAVVPVTIELIEKHALIVDGDETEKPDKSEWKEFFEAVAPGDVYQLSLAVLELHNESSEQTFGDLVKA